MPIPFPWRSQQTSSTAGTGTLTLNAAPANRIGFSTSVGGSQTVEYSLSVAGTNQWEIGTGVFNGANPGTLTRVTVVASSNAGSLVSFIGTIDVILAYVPGQRPRATFPTTSTATIAELGNYQTMTGSTNGTLNLPAVATVPTGAGYLVVNAGTAGAWLTIDPSGAETINGATTLILFTGESVEIFATSSGWIATGLQSRPLVRRQTASASAQIDFVLPPGFTAFEVEFNGMQAATSTAFLTWRSSVDSGSSFAAGGSDYFSSAGTASAVTITPALSTASAAATAMGEVEFTIGSGSLRPTLKSEAVGVDSGASAYAILNNVGARNATAAINAVRFIMNTGTIAAGTFSLYAVR